MVCHNETTLVPELSVSYALLSLDRPATQKLTDFGGQMRFGTPYIY